MLEICLCEDQIAIRQQLSGWISGFCMLSDLDVCLSLATDNPTLVLEYAKSVTNPVLFFLDIDLGHELNGMDLAREIRELNKESFIVFITTKSEMAPLTFKYQLEALDFIIKDEAEDEIRQRLISSIKTAIKRHVKPVDGKVLQIKTDDKVVALPMSEILYIETTPVRYKLKLHTATRRLSINGELKKMAGEVDERFVRAHQSYLVNRDHIKEIDYSGNMITLTDGSEIPLSRSGKKLLRELMR